MIMFVLDWPNQTGDVALPAELHLFLRAGKAILYNPS